MALPVYVKELDAQREDTTLGGDASADFPLTLTAVPAAANAVVLFWGARIASIASLNVTVTDTKGNTWQVVFVGTGSTVAAIAATDQAAGTLTLADTITVHSGNGQTWTSYVTTIEEFTNVPSPLVLDATATNTGTGATSGPTGTTAATAVPNELALAMCALKASGTITKDASYTSPTTGSRSVGTGALIAGFGTYKILSATGPQSATYTFASGQFAACIATIKGVNASLPKKRALTSSPLGASRQLAGVLN